MGTGTVGISRNQRSNEWGGLCLWYLPKDFFGSYDITILSHGFVVLSICRFPAHDCSGCFHVFAPTFVVAMESCPLWIFPCTRLRLAMPEAEQTVVGVLKGGTGFRENLRRKKPFSLKAIYLDVSLSAPQKMGHAPNIIFVVSKMANFRNWGTDWDTSGFF